MKKRILTLALALMFTLCAAIPALAAGPITTSGGTGNATITYTVSQSFTVTIPDAITVTDATKTGKITVSVAANTLIAHGKMINVKLTACAFKLTNNTDEIAYTLTNDTAENVVLNGTILTHGAGEQEATSEELTVTVTGSPIYSGDYTDTLTFAVAVE